MRCLGGADRWLLSCIGREGSVVDGRRKWEMCWGENFWVHYLECDFGMFSRRNIVIRIQVSPALSAKFCGEKGCIQSVGWTELMAE